MWIKLLREKLEDEVGTDGAAAGGGAGGEAAEAPAAETSSSPAPVDGSTPLDFDGISAMLSFDPFAEEASPTVSAAEATATVEVGGESAPAVPATQAPVTPPATPATQDSPEVLALQAQVQAMQAHMAQLTQQAQQQQQRAAPGGNGQGDPLDQFIPPYQFQIPEQMLAMLDSENPKERAQGMSTLMGAALRTAHKNILQQVNGMMATYVPQQLNSFSQQQELRTSISNDFYGTYKELNTPEMRRVVTMLLPQVMQETGATNWNPKLRDALAQKVKGMLSGFAPAPTPAPATPPMFQAGSRGPTGGQDSVTRDILSLL